MIKKLTEYITRLSPVQRNIFTFSIIALTIGLVYYLTPDFKYCIDDQYYLWLYIEEGSSVQEYLESMRQRFWIQQYRPVTFASIMAEAVLFGKNPEVHHGFNLLYYTALCYLIFFLTFTFFKKYEVNSYYLGLLVAFLFLLHPSHANVVSSIKNREAILSMTFGLLSMYTWWRFLDTRKLKMIFFSILFLLLGVFAKKDVLPFILLIPVSGYLYTGKFKIGKEGFYLLLSVAAFVVSYLFILGSIAEPVETSFRMSYFENPMIEKVMGFKDWLPYSLYILSIYEKFMVWPTGYLFYFGYDQIEVIDYWNSRTILSFMAHFLVVISIIVLFVKKKV